MKVIKGESGKLPFGTFSIKEKKRNTAICIILEVIFAIISIYIYIITNSLILCLLLLVFFFYILLLIIAYFGNGFNRALRKYLKNCNFNEFEYKINEYLKNELHSESRNFILMQYSSILLNYDSERAFSMWESVKEPIIDELVYHFYKIQFVVEKKEYEKAMELITEFKKKCKNKILMFQILNLEYKIMVLSSDKIIDNIEDKLYFKKSNLFNTCCTYTTLMIYFRTRGVRDKAIYYSNLIKSLNLNMPEIDKEVKLTLEEE